MQISTTTIATLAKSQTVSPKTAIIVWGNSEADYQFIRHLGPNICFIPAQDIEDSQLSFMEKLVIGVMPDKHALKLMNSRLGQQIRHSQYPWHPPLNLDIRHLIKFMKFIKEKKMDNIIVACEYGRSRSVATAHFLKHKLGGSYSNERVGNLRIRRLLGSYWDRI